jgi:Cdc6-like AAA superfamily ATPase
VIDNLHAQAKEPVLYFYCSRDDKDRNTPTATLRNLIKQLVKLNGGASAELHERHQETDKRELQYDEAAQFLVSHLNKHKQIIIVIDALDEVGLKDELVSLLESLEKTFLNIQETVVKICV